MPDDDHEERVEGHTFVIPVGTVLYGYCGGEFGEPILDDDRPNPPKRVEAIGVDWIVVRYCDWNEGGAPLFAHFVNRKVMEELVAHWMIRQDAGFADNSRTEASH